MAVSCATCGYGEEPDWLAIVDHSLNDLLDELPESLNLHLDDSAIWLARCTRRSCLALSYWLRSPSEHSYDGWSIERFVALYRDVRQPPNQGLESEEAELYREAAAVAGLSPRSACALLRLLMESFLKRHLSLNPPIRWVCVGCRVREKGLLICDDCDVRCHIRLKNRRHFLCLDHRAVWTGSQRRSIMRAWWPTRA